MAANGNLYAQFQKNFPTDLDQELLTDIDGCCISYRKVDDFSARVANILLQMGAKRGDRVTVQVEKSIENLYLYLGCLRAGLIYHPLNTAYTASELTYFLADAEPTIAVCDSSVVHTFQSSMPTGAVKALLTLDADGSGSLMKYVANAVPLTEVAQSEGAEIAALLYSSGTTGQPKGIMLSHENLRENVQALVDAWGFSASDRLLHVLPIYHVHGLFVGLGCVLMSGARMVWHSRFSEKSAVEAIPSCTVMMGVPTYYTRLLGNQELCSERCSNMRLFISGSAPLLSETFDAFKLRTGHTILERYGMTETGMNTSNPLVGERRGGTVGPPLPSVQVRVVDEEGLELADGETGNLQVRGPNVFLGYWRMPEKTAEDLTDDGFFNTGDKAVIGAEGYVSIVGRSKDMIISGGLNVYPKEIELVIDEMLGVSESAVIGVPDADFGEVVFALIVGDGEAPTSDKVIAHCKNQLANFKVPKRVETIDSLPRNAMGKVQKNRLREEFLKV